MKMTTGKDRAPNTKPAQISMATSIGGTAKLDKSGSTRQCRHAAYLVAMPNTAPTKFDSVPVLTAILSTVACVHE